MSLYETKILFMRDEDMNVIQVFREENGLLFSYDERRFFMLMTHPHMNLYIIADINEADIRDGSIDGPFEGETEQNLAIESWERLKDFDSYLNPHSKESAPVFLKDFNRIWGVAERLGYILED